MTKLRKRCATLLVSCCFSWQVFCQDCASGNTESLLEGYDQTLEDYQMLDEEQQALIEEYQRAYESVLSDWQQEVSFLNGELISCEKSARRWRGVAIAIGGVTVGVTLVAIPLLIWRK